MNEITTSIYANYYQHQLGQTPRSLITDQIKWTPKIDRPTKAPSAIIIVSLGSHTIKSLQVTSLSV